MTQIDLSQRGIRCDFCDEVAPIEDFGSLPGWFIVSVTEVAPAADRDIDVHACPGCVEALADQFMATSEHRLKLLGGQPDQDDQCATMDPIGQVDYITVDGAGGIVMGGRLGLTGDMDVSSLPPETTFVPTNEHGFGGRILWKPDGTADHVEGIRRQVCAAYLTSEEADQITAIVQSRVRARP